MNIALDVFDYKNNSRLIKMLSAVQVIVIQRLVVIRNCWIHWPMQITIIRGPQMNHHRKLVYAFLQRSKINRRPITDSPPMMSKYTTIVSAICFQFIAINVLILHVFCLLIQHFFIHNSEKNYESFAIHAMCNLLLYAQRRHIHNMLK